jgi:hypothetical protein
LGNGHLTFCYTVILTPLAYDFIAFFRRNSSATCSYSSPFLNCFAHFIRLELINHTLILGIGCTGGVDRTSFSALSFHTKYITTAIPLAAITVFDFQLDGRDHQPPRCQSFGVQNLPDGDLIC